MLCTAQNLEKFVMKTKLAASCTMGMVALTIFVAFALDNKVLATKPAMRKPQPTSRTQVNFNPFIVYSENFDAGAPGWTFRDLWSESFWHVSTTGAYAGKSYWCGIEKLGGYDDKWIQTLTSSPIDLSATTNPMLTFMHNYSLEPPAGASDGYDAWDAVTVRISTDGTTFNVIQPAGGYPYHSAYGFHLYYGTGIGGWAGQSNRYVQQTINLSAFAGKKVWIRFEFGADDGYSHENDASLWGWRVDNIEIADGGTRIFFDDAGDTGTAQFAAGGPGGPNLWHITGDAAASAPNSAGCFDRATKNYLPRMKAGLISPAIAIKALPPDKSKLILDFQVQGTLDPSSNAGGGLNLDFFDVEARRYSGGIWSYWLEIGATTFLPGSFAGFNQMFPDFPLDATALIGADSVQFRISVLTQPDGAVLPPANVFIDDFALTAASEADLILGPRFKAFFERVTAAPVPQRSAIADSFMATISSFPFIEEKTIAYFLYRGSVNSVNVPGDANSWNTSAFPMVKLAGTNLWYKQAIFEPDARLDYKFFLNGSTWILDPLNPKQVSGGFGPNSELAMSNYVQPPEIEFQVNIPHGALRDTTISSTILGNSRKVQIYTPPSYQTAVNDSFPVVLFHDGLEYVTLAKANNVLDYLIAKNRIKPVIAVFVPPVNRDDEYALNMTSQYESFIVGELMPIIDKRYHTKRNPASRAMIGISFGGLIATQICYNHPKAFGLCGPFSPAYWPRDKTILKMVTSGEKKDIKWYLDWGTYEISIMLDGRMLQDKLATTRYQVAWREWHEGHSWGSWRAHLDNALEYFFPANVVSVNDNKIIPLQFSLHQNYPNPFSQMPRFAGNPSTTISYDLPKSVPVKLVVYNVLGKEVRKLVDATQAAGHHQITWNGKNELGASVASGVYFYRIKAGDFEMARKLMLMR